MQFILVTSYDYMHNCLLPADCSLNHVAFEENAYRDRVNSSGDVGLRHVGYQGQNTYRRTWGSSGGTRCGESSSK